MATVLYHQGIRGMKWGVRRYQNADGSYKAGAEGRYAPDSNKEKNTSERSKSSGKSSDGEKKRFQLSEGQKKALKIGAAVAGTVLVAYGAYKLGSTVKQVNRGKDFMNSLSPELQGKVQQMLDEQGMTAGNMFGKTKAGSDAHVNAIVAKSFQQDLDNARTKLNRIKANPAAFTQQEREKAVDDVNYWQKTIDETLGIKSGYKKELQLMPGDLSGAERRAKNAAEFDRNLRDGKISVNGIIVRSHEEFTKASKRR